MCLIRIYALSMPRAAGYDFINSAEATAAEVMSAAGYNAVHYGKW
jgi:arylsulfatase A-like enzyme